MRIGDILYFSPNFAFRDLNFDDPALIVEAFSDRVDGFYFEPTRQLIQSRHAFAAGLILCAGVEFAAFAYKQKPDEWRADRVQIDAARAKAVAPPLASRHSQKAEPCRS